MYTPPEVAREKAPKTHRRNPRLGLGERLADLGLLGKQGAKRTLEFLASARSLGHLDRSSRRFAVPLTILHNEAPMTPSASSATMT